MTKAGGPSCPWFRFIINTPLTNATAETDANGEGLIPHSLLHVSSFSTFLELDSIDFPYWVPRPTSILFRVGRPTRQPI